MHVPEKGPEAIIHDFEENRAAQLRERRRTILRRGQLGLACAGAIGLWWHSYPQWALEGTGVLLALGLGFWRQQVLEEQVRALQKELNELRPRSSASKTVIDT